MPLYHTFDPVWDERSRILILGSFPSVRSREEGFYYGHPRNRFWPLIANLTGSPLPHDIEEKRALLLRNQIALWDVCAACEVDGSSDASIRRAAANDLTPILSGAPIEAIFTNGQTAHRLYCRLIEPVCHIGAVCLPSTSPANAAWSLDRLCDEWRNTINSDIIFGGNKS